MVTDFGIARLAEATPLTATGQVLGTVYYLSPEQVSGERVDARSDIYSLGVVGYFALSGRFPFDAAVASAVLIAHVTKTPPPLHDDLRPTRPRALDRLVDRCLAKDPGDRFQTAMSSSKRCRRSRTRRGARCGARCNQRGRARTPALLSDTEAQAIWRRAADLQAQTGIQPRPAPIARRARRRTRRGADIGLSARRHPRRRGRSGHLGEVRRPRVRRARLCRRSAARARPPMLVDRSKPRVAIRRRPHADQVRGRRRRRDAGGRLRSARRLDSSRTGEAGQLAVVGRSFSWQNAAAEARGTCTSPSSRAAAKRRFEFPKLSSARRRACSAASWAASAAVPIGHLGVRRRSSVIPVACRRVVARHDRC